MNAWLTPETLPSTTRQCVLEFPDSEEFQSLVLGALSLLADEKNYEEFGAVTAIEVGDAMRQTLFSFMENDCVIFPVGGCLDWPSNTIPDGFLDTAQGAVSRTTYAALFAVLGTTWGSGDGSTTFDLPHKDGRVSVGKKSGDANFDTLGENGGSSTHTLSTGEIPAHNHQNGTAQVLVDNSALDVSGSFKLSVATTGSRWKNANIASVGSGSAHNNLQPYVVMNYIIKF